MLVCSLSDRGSQLNQATLFFSLTASKSGAKYGAFTLQLASNGASRANSSLHFANHSVRGFILWCSCGPRLFLWLNTKSFCLIVNLDGN